ncbi:hypothetical protein SeMB42_g02127 [Synchytrium endobioticum]|uniref:ABC transporter domain-containing protein n=1 Tax=Synchytrium endobioticum TaxID=286115 RepID=A0A507DDU0_9FUNG|nr:hypothetical protein SeLEV6574_g01699 [Synchytrium endobioticum]TPX50802.1 hypothetical protein SeMB42_g02127 [Synchytrium endobioticum]
MTNGSLGCEHSDSSSYNEHLALDGPRSAPIRGSRRSLPISPVTQPVPPPRTIVQKCASPLSAPLLPASPNSLQTSLKNWVADAITAEQGQQLNNRTGPTSAIKDPAQKPSFSTHHSSSCISTRVTSGDGGVELTWRNLHYKVPLKRNAEKHILKGVSGDARSGELLAVLGGSGAGKSTLMDALSGRARGGILTGDIRFNNYASDMGWRKSIGYVMQDDIFWETLTVHETLSYAALLKLPESMNREEREEQVVKVVQQMRLIDCLDSRVGDTVTRGISGGERKRLSIAMELLSEPDIMMLDEPTSGLDAFSAFVVMDLLRTLAVKERRTIIVSIHQPRKEILDMFDRVLIMARGEVLFFGKVDEACGYFAHMGYAVPVLTNPADHFLDMATFDTSSLPNLRISSRRIESLQHLWKTRYDRFEFPPHRKPPQQKLRPRKEMTYGMCHAVSDWAWRVWFLMFRQWKVYTRDTPMILMGVISNTIFIVLFGVLWWQMALTQAGAKARLGFFFMFGLNRYFTSTFGVVLKLPLRISLYMRERAAGMYSGSMAFWALYWGTWIQFLWLTTPTLVSVYFLVGLQGTLDKFIMYFIAGNFVYLSGHTYGILFGSLAGSVSGALLYSLILVGIFAGYSGYIVVPTSIPKPLLFISWIDPLFLGFHAWTQSEFSGLNLTCATQDRVCYSTGESVLTALSLYSMSRNVAILTLSSMIIITSFLAYFAFESVTRPPYVEFGVLVEAFGKGLSRINSLSSLSTREAGERRRESLSRV